MRRLPLAPVATFAVAVLAVVAAPLAAQTAAPTAPVDRIVDEGTNRSEVMRIAQYLSDVIGARLTNSPGMRKAEAWTQDKFREWGLVNVHKEGFEFVRRSAMQKVKAPFEVVVTTNSGYPLDMNLYQGVKGMSAGARILEDKGLLILACECSEGVPTNSPLDKLLRSFVAQRRMKFTGAEYKPCYRLVA